jgi:uncharacterized protein YbaR (Trm112 family)
MVDQKLLSILCCPETKQDLELLDDATVKRINKRIAEGGLKNRGGEEVKDPIDGALLRQDRAYFYPIREDIPIMLIDEAISYEEFSNA